MRGGGAALDRSKGRVVGVAWHWLRQPGCSCSQLEQQVREAYVQVKGYWCCVVGGGRDGALASILTQYSKQHSIPWTEQAAAAARWATSGESSVGATGLTICAANLESACQ